MATHLLSRNPEIYLVSTPFPNGFLSGTNCYVVHEGDGWLIIDTGYPDLSVRHQLRDQLQALGIDWKHAACFITHQHHDHVGLVDKVIPAGTPIYLGKRGCTRFMHTEGSLQLSSTSIPVGAKERFLSEGTDASCAEAFQEVSEADLGFDPRRYDIRLVDEGDTIAAGACRLQVVDLSGHAYGHLGLLEPQSATLFCGDHILAEVSPSIAPSRGVPGYDALGSYLDNLHKVRAMPLARLAWAHGPLFEEFAPRIDYLIEHHQRRIREALDIVRSADRLGGEAVVRAMTWNVPFDTWDDIPVLQRSVILGEGFAVLDYLVDRGGIVREVDARGKRFYSATLVSQ